MHTAAMEKSELVQARIKKSIKSRAAMNAEKIGLPLSTVISVLLANFAAEGVLPAVRVYDIPNAETLAAMEEADGMLAGRIESKPLNARDFLREMQAYE